MRTFGTTACIVALTLAGCSTESADTPVAESETSTETAQDATQDAPTTEAAVSEASTQPQETSEAMSDDAPFVYVTLTTNKGEMVVELDRENAPITVANFLQYVEEGHYNNTVFHRLTKGGIFVIQGGGFGPGMQRKATREPIVNEASNGLSNIRGTLSMARTNDPNSATSQFFINVYDNVQLDRNPASAGYAVFGQIVEGLDVMDQLHATPIAGGAQDGRPESEILIEGAAVVDADAAKGMMDERDEILARLEADREEARARANEIREEAMREMQEQRERMMRQQMEQEMARWNRQYEMSKELFETEEAQTRWNEQLAQALGTLRDRGIDVDAGAVNEETLNWSLILEEGTGDSPEDKIDTVSVHATGWLPDGEQFWSSYDAPDGQEAQPAIFTLNGVVQGWGLAVESMRVGEKRMIVIPSEFAYGARGRSDAQGNEVIAPNTALIFELELIALP